MEWIEYLWRPWDLFGFLDSPCEEFLEEIAEGLLL